jgi:voltage-gated potassium channel Kch
VVEGEIAAALGKRKLLKMIKKLRDHYIICGFGRIGEIIARQLRQRGVPLVIIDTNPELLAELEKSGYYFIPGDATKEEVLQEAGLERARGLVSVVRSDAANVYITLTARSLNPDIFIVARGEEAGSEQKLLRAGADKVESPYEMGGRKMAHTILRPTVTTFMELAARGVEWSMEDLVGRDPPWRLWRLKTLHPPEAELIVGPSNGRRGDALQPTPKTHPGGGYPDPLGMRKDLRPWRKYFIKGSFQFSVFSFQ